MAGFVDQQVRFSRLCYNTSVDLGLLLLKFVDLQ